MQAAPVDDTAAAPDRNIALIMCAVFAPGRVINFGSSRRETYRYDLGGYVGSCEPSGRDVGDVVRGWVCNPPGYMSARAMHPPGAAHGSSSRCYCAERAVASRPAICKLFRALN